MNPQTARNALAFIHRDETRIPLTAKEAVEFAEFLRELEEIARGEDERHDP